MKRNSTRGAAIITALSFHMFMGCGSHQSTGPAQPVAGENHEHGDAGPHHGQIVELGGGDYHAEIVDEHDTGKVTVYLLDSQAKKPAATDHQVLVINVTIAGKPKQFSLAALPLENEPAGHSSRFEISNQELTEALHDANAKGRVNVTMNGKAFVGDIQRHMH